MLSWRSPLSVFQLYLPRPEISSKMSEEVKISIYKDYEVFWATFYQICIKLRTTVISLWDYSKFKWIKYIFFFLLTCVFSKSFSTKAFSLFSCAFSSDCVSVSSVRVSKTSKKSGVHFTHYLQIIICKLCIFSLVKVTPCESITCNAKYLSRPSAGLQASYSWGIWKIQVTILTQR